MIKALPNGLILRRSTPEDTDALAKFQARIHGEGEEFPLQYLEDWVRDLMSGSHPTFHADDFTIVEDTSTGQIVSSLCLIDQTWTYSGIPFQVGRPELVATDRAYRNQGLVREQMNVVHDWSRERGQILQAITGIPYYYRLFGYEMTLELDGGRNTYEFQIPKKKPATADAYVFRPAVSTDIPFINALYDQAASRSLVHCLRDEKIWEYEINGRLETDMERLWYFVIETAGGDRIGILAHMNELWGPTMPVKLLEIIPGHPWMAACQEALRFAWSQGKTLAEKFGHGFNVLGLWLGSDHPAYHALPDSLPKVRDPYAFFIRLPDLCAFLDHIKPALERRLEESVASGYTGELPISFFSDGIKFHFKNGLIAGVEPYREKEHEAQAYFPPQSFFHLVFGTKSLSDLIAFYADCSIRPCSDARPILEAIFPRAVSNVIPLS
jgi:hypothetical protein